MHNEWACLCSNKTLFTKTSSRLDLAHGLSFVDPSYKQSTVEEGRKIQARIIEKLPSRGNKAFETSR